MNKVMTGDWTERVNRVVSSSIHEQLQSISEELRSGFESTWGSADQMRASFDTLEKRLVDRASDDFKRLGELVFSLSMSLSELRQEMIAMREAIEPRIAAVEERLETFERRLGTLEAREAADEREPASLPGPFALRMERAADQLASGL